MRARVRSTALVPVFVFCWSAQSLAERACRMPLADHCLHMSAQHRLIDVVLFEYRRRCPNKLQSNEMYAAPCARSIDKSLSGAADEGKCANKKIEPRD